MFLEFITSNFALLCIAITMIFIVIYNMRGYSRENHYAILIIAGSLILSIFGFLERYNKTVTLNIFLTTLFCFLGYVVRPLLVYFFIQLVDKKVKYQWIFYIPLIFNLIVYSFSLFVNVDPLNKFAFYYTFNEGGTELVYNRGYMNFTAHVIGMIYVGYFFVNVVRKLNGKRKTDSIVLFVAGFFVISAVILETFNLATNLLNLTIAISCLFYYLYLYVQQTRKDALTGCFDRKTFYYDFKKLSKNINGVLNIDMNGLKFINDTEGHDAGDKAILKISQIIEACASRNSYVYRLGGDEFTVLLINGQLTDLEKMRDDIKAKTKETKYAVSVGFAFDENKELDLEKMSKIADEQMYIDKDNYYRNSKLERRKNPRQ